jgi:hypothetical protein
VWNSRDFAGNAVARDDEGEDDHDEKRSMSNETMERFDGPYIVLIWVRPLWSTTEVFFLVCS